MGANVVRFGPFEFDFEEMVLRHGGAPVPLQPQPTQVLAILLEVPGRLVGREELKSRVWENRIVEFDAGLNFSVNQVRRALGDSANRPQYVETVHRRGYRFIATVEDGGPDGGPAPSRGALRTAAWLLGVVLVAAFLVRVVGRAASVGSDGSLEALAPTVQSTYRAAQWLYEHGEAQRALARLDSVRLAQPDFARAWALTSHARRVGHDLSGARVAAERAVELDPSLADAYYASGLVAFLETRELDALEAFREASRLEPHQVEYRQWYAQALANRMRLDEAIAQLETARRLDPISNLVGVDLATVYSAAGRFDDALTYCSDSLELVTDNERWARECLLTAYYLKGERRLASEQARVIMEYLGATPAEIAAVLTPEDYFRWDLARIERLQAAGKASISFDRVRATARLRDRAETLRGLRSLRDARHYGIQWVPRDPWFWFLHGDPEFDAILREAGLPIPGPAP